MGLGPDARGDAQQHLLGPAGGDPLEPVDLVERVDDDVADAAGQRVLQLGRGLVVAVHVDPLGIEAGAQREVQLAAGRDVAGQSGLGEDPQRRGAGERLARVEDLEVVGARGEGVLDRAGAQAQVVLGVDVGGRAELARQLDHVTAADLEPSGGVDPRAERIDVTDPSGQGIGLLGVRQRLLRIVLAHEDADYEAPSRLQAIARTDPRSDMCDAR